MGVWQTRDGEYEEFQTPHWPEVTVTEPEVIGVLLGPDGEPMMEFYDKEPIGFRLR